MERHYQGKSRSNKALICVLILAVCVLIVFSILFITSVSAEGVRTSHIVMDVASGRVLSGDHIRARLPMASTTKVVTAIVAIEHAPLDMKIEITRDMAGIEGSSIYLKVGEVLTLRELLYGLMLRSGNDAATAIAIGVSGSVEEFVALMNDLASRLGLSDTHFVNPHGLHHDEHYTSSYDLARLASYAMHNDTFREIVGTRSIVIGGDTSDKRYLVNKNKILSMYACGTGIKTGFTKKAGRCLVSSARLDGMDVVSVVLNEPDMWEYSIRTMQRALERYTLLDIVSEYRPIYNIKIGDNYYDICTHNTLKYPVTRDEMNDLSYDVKIFDNIDKVTKGQNIGKLLVYRDKHLIFEEKIYTM